MLEEITPEHFDYEIHRRVREALIGQPDDRELVEVIADLDALAAAEEITENGATEALLRLRARGLRRELQHSGDLELTRELQTALARIEQAVGGLT